MAVQGTGGINAITVVDCGSRCVSGVGLGPPNGRHVAGAESIVASRHALKNLPAHASAG